MEAGASIPLSGCRRSYSPTLEHFHEKGRSTRLEPVVTEFEAIKNIEHTERVEYSLHKLAEMITVIRSLHFSRVSSTSVDWLPPIVEVQG